MTIAEHASDRVTLLAGLISGQFAGAGEGHCVRVNYLTKSEAEAICNVLAERTAEGLRLSAHVLAEVGESSNDETLITADRAIELRNRKRGLLCLFVPAEVVDATASSLGNSFAEIDGRDLLARGLRDVRSALPPLAASTLENVFMELRYGMRASRDAHLELALTLRGLVAAGREDDLGRELWRVGLISDAGNDFDRRLAGNRSAVQKLARPPRLGASFRDRIASLGVSPATGRELERFFTGRPLTDVAAWSRDLIVEGLTFDRWVFPAEEQVGLDSVHVKSFKDAAGAVLKTAKLSQPDGLGGHLVAHCDQKASIAVRWESNPLRPASVPAWRVAVVPARDEQLMEDEVGETESLDLPVKEIPGSRRTTSLKLDLDFIADPEDLYCVRVAAIDAAGNEMIGADGKSIADLSDQFYLSKQAAPETTNAAPRRRTVPNIAVGRLEAALDTRDREIVLSQPTWTDGRGVTYFSARVNERTLLNVALSPFLKQIQERTVGDYRGGGRWLLQLDELRPASIADVREAPHIAESDIWAEYWSARRLFLERLAKAKPRHLIEAAEWTDELTNAALRQGRAYSELLEKLPAADLADALSLDTLLVRMPSTGDMEEAAIVLPTHPLRVAWMASHAALVRRWEERVLEQNQPGRRQLIDRELVRTLEPVNMPALAAVWTGTTPFLFFRNLSVFHGVALPAEARDPLRRFHDVALVLSAQVEHDDAEGRRVGQLARHIEEFRRSHPYADPFAVALVNPDRGELLAEALLERKGSVPEEDEEHTTAAIEIAAYAFNGQRSRLDGLTRLRHEQEQWAVRRGSDFLRPAMSTSVRAIERIDEDNVSPVHLALVSDLSLPVIRTALEGREGGSSLTLYGLIARFTGVFTAADGSPHWEYRVEISPGAKMEAHPAGQRFGDMLADLQRMILRALGRMIEPTADGPLVPVLSVELGTRWAERLERLHVAADWVVTLDRFFGIDYYDSPEETGVAGVAQKYLIDYAPEFVDGLGHRLIVTTASRAEVALILHRAMDDLGLAAVERSVGRMLHTLKTVSGRLVLQAMRDSTSGTAAASLGVVLTWLRAKQRLRDGVLVPVDPHARLFVAAGEHPNARGQSRCDLALVSLRRGTVDVTFIEVKWRRGPLGDLQDLIEEMRLQMAATRNAWDDRFFNSDRIDSPLQRAELANVIRFYVARARRYGLLNRDNATAFTAGLAEFERRGAVLRTAYHGFIVSLNDAGRQDIIENELVVKVLTAADLDFAELPVIANTEAANRTIPVQTSQLPVTNTPDAQPMPEAAPDSPAPMKGTPTTDIRIELGDHLGSPILWRPSIQGSPHLFITGIPGQGKSVTIIRILGELYRDQVPALVFDFHGDLGAGLGLTVDKTRTQTINAAEGLPFSPFECSPDSSQDNWDATAFGVAEIFAHVCNLGPVQQDTLYTCIRDAYLAKGFGSDSEGIPAQFPSLADVLRRLERAEHQGMSQNVLARCRPILQLKLFRPPTDGTSGFSDAVMRGLTIDLHRLPSETQQLAAGAFLLRKIYREMFHWGPADRLRLVLVLDEAHRLSKDVTLPKLMKEGRKYGIAAVVASQGLGDFHPDILNNAGTKIAFRANHAEARKIAGFFHARAGEDLVAKLEGLPIGSAIVQTPEMSTAMQVKMRLAGPALTSAVSEPLP